jgi:hypothetical protein
LSQRLGVPVGELRSYGARGQTRTEHLRQVVASIDRGVEGAGRVPVRPRVEHDSPKLLFRLACEYLTSARIVRPGVATALEHVATARARAKQVLLPAVENVALAPS